MAKPPVEATPEEEARDLGGGKVSASDAPIQQQLLDLYHQRRGQREALFGVSVVFCVIMTFAFMWFVFRMVCVFEANAGKIPDWHILMLGSALIVPPTIILFGLMRRVYDPDDGSNGNGTSPESPSGEAISQISELFKNLAELLTSTKNN